MAFEEYRRKRRFARTPEPKGKRPAARSNWRFVVQKHAARRLHYDFRLEMDGVLKSWAVPKGPSLDPKERRLAVEVEDHPLEYIDFEGAIPAGEYGGGTVIVWDAGTWSTDDDPQEAYQKGKLKFELDGSKLRGGWTLVRMRRRAGEERNQWLLIKERDEHARPADEYDVLEAEPASVISGRTIEEVAADPQRVWRSNRAAAKQTAARQTAAKKTPRRRRDREGEAPAEPQGTRSRLGGSRALPRSKRRARGQSFARLDGAVAAAMPGPLRPQLAKLTSRVPAGDLWLHEIKYDGYRLLCYLDDGRVVLRTRTGLDWTGRFPEVAGAAGEVPLRQAVLDGEIVALLPSGVSSFQELQNVFTEGSTGRLVYYVFDLLYADGCDLRKVSLEQRKARLAEILGERGEGRIRYSDHIAGNGPEFFDQCCRMGLEGVISKRRDRPYRSGRSGDWLKARCVLREEFVIGGFTDPTASRKGLGALLVGYFADRRGLDYAGKVGTGFSEQTLLDLRARLESLEQPQSPFDNFKERRRGTHWVRPELVAQVEFTEWTQDGLLRHPVFQGLREDKPATEVVRRPEGDEMPKQAKTKRQETGSRKKARARAAADERAADRSASNQREQVAAARLDQLGNVHLTNPDRVLYAGQGITKVGLASFYVEIADWILPHVADRPLSLVRCPRGHGKPCFYQKHAAAGVPETIRRVPIHEKGKKADYLAIDDAAGLVALVQMGVLEIHPWGARTDRVERPDRITFDLDPDPGVAWPRVVEAARELHERLNDLGLASFLKTTGGKGLHVVVPVQRRHGWPEVKGFSKALAEQIATDSPQAYTTNPSKAARRGKIFVDYLRNDRGATAVAAYSTRARPGAPVATPLSWAELSPAIRSDHFNVGNLPGRLASLHRDPWDEMSTVRQSITVATKRKLDL